MKGNNGRLSSSSDFIKLKMENDALDDCEEEILVYLEFKDSVNIEKYRNIHILGIDSKNPIVQMDDTFYIGKYDNPFGTYLFFEEDPSPNTDDPLFDRLSEKNLKYVCKTRKCIQMQHAYVSPKEGEDCVPGNQSNKIDDDVKAVNFKTVQEAINTFKTEYRDKTLEPILID
uniref:Transcription factor TFIIIC triple barrel domain-containing protein n=1 Tax=Bombyx mori TaxID=7091 RepID=A0A8R2HNL9_BOMMO|nr:general transcription factor 3C polypeptide 6 isoform X2 [Bombyx mori]